MRRLALVPLILLLTGCPGPSNRNTGTEKGGLALRGAHSKAEIEDWVAELCEDRGWTHSRVTATGSMEPNIDSTSIVILEPVDGKDVKIGETVSYRRPDRSNPTLHRISALNDEAFIPTGIANSRSDGWIPRSAITHRLVATFHTNGK